MYIMSPVVVVEEIKGDREIRAASSWDGNFWRKRQSFFSNFPRWDLDLGGRKPGPWLVSSRFRKRNHSLDPDGGKSGVDKVK